MSCIQPVSAIPAAASETDLPFTRRATSSRMAQWRHASSARPAPAPLALLAITLALLPPATAQTLSGRVVEDHTGAAVVSANVRVSRPGQRFLAADLETDREGRFSVQGLPAGDYRLEIIKRNYSNTKLSASTGAPVEARLVRRGVITGHVRDQRNQPVAGVRVFALPKGAGAAPLRPPTGELNYIGVSDSAGEYRLFNLPPGEYAVAVTYGASTIAMGSVGRSGTPPQFGSGFQFYPTNARPDFLAVSGGEEHRNIDFTLLAGALFNVSGKVDTGEPEIHFYTALIDPRQPAFTVAVAPTEKDGSFQFTGIPAGSYELVAATNRRARGFFGGILPEDPAFGRSEVNIAGQNIEGLLLKPDAARRVAFELHSAPGCPPNAQLKLIPLEDWGSVFDRTAALSAEKPALVTGLAPSRYGVDAVGPDNHCYMESEALLDLTREAPIAPVEVRLQPAGAVEGRLDTAGRAPTAFAIAMVPASAGSAIEFATPDAESRFSFEGLRPGRYRIGAFPAAQRAPDIARMFEFEVRGGSNAQIDLVAPEGDSQ